jgi:Translation-initiation factor 2
VCVQASTLGSLEALLTFLKSDAVQIPVSGINIGPIHKKDVMRASVMLEKVRGRVETSLLTRLSEPHYSGSLPSLGDPDSRPLSCLMCRMCRLHMQRMTSTPGKQCISDASPAVVQGAKKFAVILAFDVPMTREARDLAESMGVRIFTADIIYHLFDQFTAYLKQVRKRCNQTGCAVCNAATCWPAAAAQLPALSAEHSCGSGDRLSRKQQCVPHLPCMLTHLLFRGTHR